MSNNDHSQSYFNFSTGIGSFSLLHRLLGYETDSSLQSRSSPEPNAQNILGIHRGKKTLMSNILTPELFNEYKDKVTDLGLSLFDGLKQGLKTDSQWTSPKNIGFAVGDERFYSLFSKVLDTAILLLNNYLKELDNYLYGARINKESIEMVDDFGLPESGYIMSCRIRVLRSFSGYPFTWACSDKQRKDIEIAVKAVLENLEECKISHYIQLSDLSDEAITRLTLGHGIYRSYPIATFKSSAEGSRHHSVCWLSGRGMFCGYIGTPVVLVNENEHLKFIIQQKGYKITNLFTRLYDFINKVESLLKENGKEFALHETYGYMTSNPRETGSGLRISVILKLPLLIQEPRFNFILQRLALDKALENSKIGAIELSNRTRYGLTEVCILELFVCSIKWLIGLEEMLEHGKMIDEAIMSLLEK